MKNDLLDSMSQAVENSSVIIVCCTRRYKESANCRLEAGYAHKLRKPMVPLRFETYHPDGWLGLLEAQRMYVDMSSGISQEKLANLLQEIHSHIQVKSVA
eukprot:Lithocolla_globosa_v1_NODE_2944_length_1815_cov_7.523864.p2 type:complete len:100 gc:universal NODE_2944_length_1815_cov_7.523864:1580-1281(-)